MTITPYLVIFDDGISDNKYFSHDGGDSDFERFSIINEGLIFLFDFMAMLICSGLRERMEAIKL